MKQLSFNSKDAELKDYHYFRGYSFKEKLFNEAKKNLKCI
jgi:hypothetical protein